MTQTQQQTGNNTVKAGSAILGFFVLAMILGAFYTGFTGKQIPTIKL